MELCTGAAGGAGGLELHGKGITQTSQTNQASLDCYIKRNLHVPVRPYCQIARALRPFAGGRELALGPGASQASQD